MVKFIKMNDNSTNIFVIMLSSVIMLFTDSALVQIQSAILGFSVSLNNYSIIKDDYFEAANMEAENSIKDAYFKPAELTLIFEENHRITAIILPARAVHKKGHCQSGNQVIEQITDSHIADNLGGPKIEIHCSYGISKTACRC